MDKEFVTRPDSGVYLERSIASPLSITTLEDQITELTPQWTGDSITLQMVYLRRQRNLLTPIMRLPVEILAEILHWSMGSWPWSLNRLRDLAQVSWCWHRLVMSSPRLWWKVDFGQKPQVNDMILKLNPGGPLSILYHGYPTRNMNCRKFLEMIVEHAWRWEDVEISVGRLEQDLLDGLQRAGTLKHLNISTGSLENPEIEFSPSAQLQTLSLRCVSPQWDTCLANLCNIRILTLDSVILPPANHMLTLLMNSPKLQEFYISARQSPFGETVSMMFYDIGDTDVDDWPGIVLPQLARLHLGQLPASFTTLLLARIDAPSLCHLEIQELDSENFDPIIAPCFQPLLILLLRSSHKVVVRAREWAGSISIDAQSKAPPDPLTYEPHRYGPNAALCLRIPVARLLHWPHIVSTLEQALSGGIEVDINSPAVAPALSSDTVDARHILRDLKMIDKVSLRGNALGITTTIRYMAERHEDIRGLPCWPCPRLVDLEARTWVGIKDKEMWMDAFILFAQNRSSDAAVTDLKAADIPTSLKSLRLNYRVANTLSRRGIFPAAILIDVDNDKGRWTKRLWRKLRHPLTG